MNTAKLNTQNTKYKIQNAKKKYKKGKKGPDRKISNTVNNMTSVSKFLNEPINLDFEPQYYQQFKT